MKDKTEQMAEVFKALGDPTRLRIVRVLWLARMESRNHQSLSISKY